MEARSAHVPGRTGEHPPGTGDAVTLMPCGANAAAAPQPYSSALADPHLYQPFRYFIIEKAAGALFRGPRNFPAARLAWTGLRAAGLGIGSRRPPWP
jgi:hypothetical protein